MTHSYYPEGCQQCSPTVQGVARNYSTERNAGVTPTRPIPPQGSSSETGVSNITRVSQRNKTLSEKGKKMLEELQEDAKEKMKLRKERRVQELRVEKERKKRLSVVKCQEEERKKIKQRTEKRLAELRVEYLRNEEEQDRQWPS